MHNRERLGVAPAELLLRHLPAGLPNSLERDLVNAHNLPLVVLRNLSLEALAEPLPRHVAEHLVRVVESLPLDGFDSRRDNAEGAELRRARDAGQLRPLVLPDED